jgi:transcriptional regulator with XRE-family HTH domain
MASSSTSIGSRIRAARLARKISQKEFGAAVGLDQSQISRIESGTYQAPPEHINDIAETLGVSVAYLFGRNETESELSFDAIELALAIQKLTPEQRRAVKQLISAMTKES